MTDGYMRILRVFNDNPVAHEFLRDDGEGGFASGVDRMAAEIARLRAALDAPLTPAEAMARCPEVAALVRAADYARGGFSWTSRARNRLTAALAPFTERAGNG